MYPSGYRLPMSQPPMSSRRQMAVARDGLICRYCGCSVKPHTFVLDHVLPRSRGGRDGLSNRVVACHACDRRKADRLLSELGWVLRDPQGDPKAAPAVCMKSAKRPAKNKPPRWMRSQPQEVVAWDEGHASGDPTYDIAVRRERLAG